MKPTLKLMAAVALAAAISGCATPTPQDEQMAADARVQAAELLEAFGEALRMRRPEMIRPLLPPDMPPDELRLMETAMAEAAWLARYKGYMPDAEEAVRRIGWRRWKEGRVSLQMSGSNSLGDRTKDRFELVRVGQQWFIRHFELGAPEIGELLAPPQEFLDEVMPVVQYLMECLREGRAAEVHVLLPREAAVRWPRVSWWDRQMGAESYQPISIFDDVKRVKEFHIPRWPAPNEPPKFLYMGPGVVVAAYYIPYRWPQGGVKEPDTLTVEITFRQEKDRWNLYLFRLFAKGIPYS